MSETQSRPYSYDLVPYPSKPFPQTHPDNLATIAKLFGMQPRSISNCRVLEIGCGAGGNLLPMAEQLPDSRFVGIELSASATAEAQQVAERIGLANVQIHRLNILDFDAQFGEFDYIICHGVFSWVPREVQDRILEICGTQLAPQGVAYVSYNTYPGWHMRGMIRDLMCYHTSRYGDPQTRIQEARNVLDFLAKHAPKESAYGKLLKSESQSLRSHGDGYLYHEHLEDVNEPIYFFQFIRRAEAMGLQYLGESSIASMWTGHLPSDVTATLQRVASDLIQMEQYVDFVRNRTFRQTLLCRRGVTVDRELRPDGLDPFHVACPLVPKEPQVDVRSPKNVEFRHRAGSRGLTSSGPLVKAALVCLAEAWPGSLPFPGLASAAFGTASWEPVTSGEQFSRDVYELGKMLLEAHVNGLVEFHSAPPRFTTQISDRPVASSLARQQAETAEQVTNLRHETSVLHALARKVIGFLDGTNDRNQIVDSLVKLADDQSLVVPQGGIGSAVQQDLRTRLSEALDRTLKLLASNALLKE